MSDDPAVIKQTAGAQRAAGLAELVNKVFASERVKSTRSGHPGYRLEMSGPDGPSTTELKKVEDRLELISMETSGEARILIGSADPGMSHADLRAFDRLRALHAKTASADLPLDRADYDRVLAKVEAFFDRQGVPVTILQADAASSPEAANGPRAARGRTIPIVVGVVLVVAAIVALAKLL